MMYFNFESITNRGQVFGDLERNKRIIAEDEYFNVYDDEDSIVMQYTGLEDMNSDPIYEGDIVDHRYGVEVVRFLGGTFLPFSDAANRPMHYEAEVIGNIYENPELINPKRLMHFNNPEGSSNNIFQEFSNYKKSNGD